MEHDIITKIIAAGHAAPSVDNCQPWMFRIEAAGLSILLDEKRAEFFGDYQFTASYVTMGAVIENMTICAAASGYSTRINTFPSDDPSTVARLEFTKSTTTDSTLYDQIGRRCTNRRKYARTPLITTPSNHSKKLMEITMEPCGSSPSMRPSTLCRLASMIDSVIFSHRLLHANLFRWLRWNAKETASTRDGMPLNSLELGVLDAFFFRLLSSWNFQAFCNIFGIHHLIGFINSRLLIHAGAIAVITVPFRTREDYLKGGRIFERFWLKATQEGYAVQPFGGIPFILTRYALGGAEGFSQAHSQTINEVMAALSGLIDPDETLVCWRVSE